MNLSPFNSVDIEPLYNLADIFANNIIDLFLTSAFPSSVNFLQIGTIYLIHYILFNLSFGLSST